MIKHANILNRCKYVVTNPIGYTDICYLTTDPPMILSSPPANSVAPMNMDHMIQCSFEGLLIRIHNANIA